MPTCEGGHISLRSFLATVSMLTRSSGAEGSPPASFCRLITGTEKLCRAHTRPRTDMPRQPTPTPRQELEGAGRDLGLVRDKWDGLCPECGETAELTSYLGSDDMRSEEHWWCPHCMLGLNVRVVRLVERARSGKTGDLIRL
jgi:hypothetical protein